MFYQISWDLKGINNDALKFAVKELVRVEFGPFFVWKPVKVTDDIKQRKQKSQVTIKQYQNPSMS